MIWKKNIDILEDMIKYLISLNVDEVVFNWLIKVGRLVENDDVCVDLKYFDDTVEKIRKFENIYKDYIKISMHRKEKFCATSEVCPGGERFFYISPEGFVSPCSWIKKMDSSFTSRKSLINTPFSEIIKEDGIQRFNKMKYERNELYKTYGLELIILNKRINFMKDKKNVWFNTSWFCHGICNKELNFEEVIKC